jgi:hypothetical protein
VKAEVLNSLFLIFHLRISPRNLPNRSRAIKTRPYYAPACYCAPRHIWLLDCVELLRDSNAPHFFYATQRRSPIAIVAGDNDSNMFATQCCFREHRKTVITSVPVQLIVGLWEALWVEQHDLSIDDSLAVQGAQDSLRRTE